MRERHERRTRSLSGLAVTLGLIAAATLVWGLDRTQHLTLDGPAPVRPAPPGTWVRTHTVTRPNGWTLLEQRVTERSTRTQIQGRTAELPGPVPDPRDSFTYCEVEVRQPGQPMGRPGPPCG